MIHADPARDIRQLRYPVPWRRALSRTIVLTTVAGLSMAVLLGCRNADVAQREPAQSGSVSVEPAQLDPLLEAGDTEAVAALLDRGMDPEFALVRAARVGSVPMVQYLLEREADPNGALDDGYKSTALMAGASGNHPEVVPVLVAAGANVDQPDAIGDPALNWAAYMGQVEYAESLLAAGARADIRSVHGNAFEIALRQGWEPLIEMLGAPAEDGLDAVEVVLLDAVSSGDLEATADALQAGASPGLRTGAGIPLLSVAASAANFEVVSRLLEAGADCQESDPIGFTPLFYSARAGSEDTVRILVAAGARIEQVADPGGMGMTALHMAAAHGRIEALQALLELGAGPDAVNIRGESALMWSVTEGHPEAALVLLAAGADPDLEGDSEYSARQAARDYGYDVVLGAMGEPEDGPDA